MNPRERVNAALSHREPDRIPLDIGGTIVTSITEAAYVPLMKHLGLPLEETGYYYDYNQRLPYLSEEFLVRLGVDTRVVGLPPELAPRPARADDGVYWSYFDKWGGRLRIPKEDGLYFDLMGCAIPDFTREAIANYRWPDWETPENLAATRENAIRLRRDTEYALCGTTNVGPGIFELAGQMVGQENFMMAMVTDRPLAEYLLDGITGHYIEEATRYMDAVGEFLDICQYGDDVATQLTWIIGPETYESMIKPRQKRLFDAVKARTSAKLMYHGCGAVFDLIPHLIDMGVDVVNPVQVSARGMDTQKLKAAYGRDIVFWGGGVDSQKVLPFGTPDDVRVEVRRRIEDLSPGGGFVWAAVHNIQAQVPPENIMAAIDTVRSYGPHRSIETRGHRHQTPPIAPQLVKETHEHG